MISKNEPVERRKHKRFQAPHGAIVGLRPPYLGIGRVINIGIGGLAFSYTADEALPSLSSELDIFLSIRNFYLCKVPFETVWDLETDGMPFSSIRTRQSGLQFGQLTPGQMSQLEFLVQNYGSGRA
ncbi:MAG: hypothetical protein JSV60_04035 [Desulfobacterales bacterium]|jgi:hypothetical protein|nr:MAG: hypothetical protein JSV60_04035 [Desulfobacterales bacterium]